MCIDGMTADQALLAAPLEEKCHYCLEGYNYGERCAGCNGTGFKPTKLGVILLSFMERHRERILL